MFQGVVILIFTEIQEPGCDIRHPTWQCPSAQSSSCLAVFFLKVGQSEKITSGWNGLPYIKCSKVFLFPATTDFVLFCLFALRQKTFRFFTQQLKMVLWDFANETTRLSQADMGHLRRQTQESGPEDRFPNNSD
jgi:hypothetical protein